MERDCGIILGMNADGLAGMGAQHLRAGRPREAEGVLRGAVLAEPGHPEANFLLGMILCRTGRWAEAVPSLEVVVAAQPTRDEALFWLAVAKKNLGEPKAAAELCRRALAINPDNPIVLNELGVCCLMVGEAAEAEKALQKACRLQPQSGTYVFNLGMALSRLDRIYRALEAFRQSAQLDPNRAEAFLEAARILEILNQRDEVLKVMHQAAKHHPQNPQVRLALASAMAATGDKENGERLYREVSSDHPDLAGSYGLWLQKEGRFSESIATFADSLKADPVQGLPYFGLAEAKTFELNGERWHSAAKAVLDAPELDLKGRTYLAYALARSAERAKDYEEAMQFYTLANASAYQLYNAGRPFDRAHLRELTDEAISTYDQPTVRRPLPGASETDCPIFIVGMIRSGTTLLDQVIASHRDVQSAGEPVFWLREADKVRRLPAASVTANLISGLAERYLSSLRVTAGESRRITDKMPLNYAHLGLIHRTFPKAKIIHMRRQPLDTCFSIFTTFLGLGPVFSYHPSNIIFSYLEYLRLMEHWRHVLPSENFIEVDYEALVEDREPIVRDLLAFCNLDWDEACLHHDQRESTISTPSKWQARQPVYKSSVERWRPYEAWLGEFMELYPT